jgi:hypothetical protein
VIVDSSYRHILVDSRSLVQFSIIDNDAIEKNEFYRRMFDMVIGFLSLTPPSCE